MKKIALKNILEEKSPKFLISEILSLSKKFKEVDEYLRLKFDLIDEKGLLVDYKIMLKKL